MLTFSRKITKFDNFVNFDILVVWGEMYWWRILLKDFRREVTFQSGFGGGKSDDLGLVESGGYP